LIVRFFLFIDFEDDNDYEEEEEEVKKQNGGRFASPAV
jgi:hypothetical protein